MGIFKKTIKGIAWMGVLRLVIRSLTFVRIAILARILAPDQFGVFGIVTLILAFFEIVTETGINVFFIQKEGKLKDYVSTAWIVSIIRGALIGILILFLTPLIVSFFHLTGSERYFYLIVLIPFIRGFINPSIVKYQKELSFNKEFLLRSFLFLADSLVAIYMCFIYKNVLGLIFGMLTSALFEVLFSNIFIKPRPRFIFEKVKFLKVIARGKWVTVTSILQYLYTNIDSMVVGRILGSSWLGIYQNAYKISTLPITEISDVFFKVTFPVFSKIGIDKNKLKSAFVKSCLIVAFLVIPAGLLIFSYSKQITLFLLGPSWLDAVGVIRILAIYGILRGITGQFPALFYALKKQEYVTYSALFAFLFVAITINFLVKRYLAEGAAYANLIASILVIPILINFYIKTFNEKGR